MKDARIKAIIFAIVTRNTNTIVEILETEDFNQESLRSISPFNIAAKFLNSLKAQYTVI